MLLCVDGRARQVMRMDFGPRAGAIAWSWALAKVNYGLRQRHKELAYKRAGGVERRNIAGYGVDLVITAKKGNWI